MPGTAERPAASSSGLGSAVRAVLVVVFSLVTLVLCIGFIQEEWGGLRWFFALVGALAFLGLFSLLVRWLKGRGRPALLGWLERQRNWMLGAWGLVLAAAILCLVVQDNAKIKGRESFLMAMLRIRTSDELADRLGSPIQAGWWVKIDDEESPTKKMEGWRLQFGISGPKGSGRVCARSWYIRDYKDQKLDSESVLVTIDATGESLELVKPPPAPKAR